MALWHDTTAAATGGTEWQKSGGEMPRRRRRIRRRAAAAAATPPVSTFALLAAATAAFYPGLGRDGTGGGAGRLVAEAFSVPGTSSTENGYDNEDAYNPMCWEGIGYDALAMTAAGVEADDGADNLMAIGDASDSRSSSAGGGDPTATTPLLTGTPWANKLVKGYMLAEDVRLFRNCPPGVDVRGDAPPELTQLGQRLRTGQWYNYTVRGSFDVSSLDGDVVTSDHGPVLGVQVILCELGRVGLCTPFVHEHANARLEAAGRTVPVVTGNRHAGTHVHSPTQFVPVQRPSGGGRQEFEVQVEVLINDPGNFFAVAAFQIFIADAINGAVGTGGVPVAERKYDVSNALETRLISYYDPPTILRVSNEITIVSGVLIAVGGGLMFFLLQQAASKIRGQVMRLSQGPFLVAFLVSAIVGTVSSFLFNPVSDLYCTVDGPMVFIPITLMYAIVIGRLWRINAVMSPLLSLTLRKDKERVFSSKFFALLDKVAHVRFFCRKKKNEDKATDGSQCKQHRRSKKLRRTVTSGQLARVVFLFTLPQLVLQACSLALQPDFLVVHYNEDESIGRVACENNDDPMSLEKWSMYYLLMLFVAMLGLAHESRELPSLFNETRSIYDAVLVSILIVAIGVAVIYLTDGPTTSPDVEYILKVIMILSMSLNTTLRVMCPKLKLMWSGQTVLVSKLVSDQQEQRRSRHASAFGGAVSGVSGASGCAPGLSQRYGGGRGKQPFQSTIKYASATPQGGDDSDDAPPPGATAALRNMQKRASKWKLNLSNSNSKRRFDENGVDNFDDSLTSPTGGVPSASSVELLHGSVFQSHNSRDEDGGAADAHAMEEGTAGGQHHNSVHFEDGDYPGSGVTGAARPAVVSETESSSAVAARRNTAPDLLLRRAVDNFEDNREDNDDDESIGLEDIQEEVDEPGLPTSAHSAPDLQSLEAKAARRAGRRRSSLSERRFSHQSSSGVDSNPNFHESAEISAAATENRAKHLRWRLRSKRREQSGGTLGGLIGGLGAAPLTASPARPQPVLTAASAEIRISDREAPARRLMLRMIDLQELLDGVNRQVMTGLAVTHGEWNVVREACTELGDVFQRDVKFEWEEDRGRGGADEGSVRPTRVVAL